MFFSLVLCQTDVNLMLLDKETNMFIRTDRRVMACFGTDFDGAVTHFFMNPTPSLAFRKLSVWETRCAPPPNMDYNLTRWP